MNPRDSHSGARAHDRGGPPRHRRAAPAAATAERHARAWFLGLTLAVALLVTARPAQAQPAVRIVGAVQWVSATNMAVMAEFGTSVAVDLMAVDQSAYRGLRTGDWVLIDGTASPDRRRVIARDIWHDSGHDAWTQAP